MLNKIVELVGNKFNIIDMKTTFSVEYMNTKLFLIYFNI